MGQQLLSEIACLGDLFTKPLLFPKFPG
jgi:hypothetical protein